MRPLRSLCVILLSASVAPSLALAGSPPVQSSLPPCCTSTLPSCVSLVGANGIVPAAGAGEFEAVIRDLASNPVPGASVVIDFSNCLDLAICADQLDPDVTVNCLAKTVRKFTDAAGAVHFTILGGSNGAGQASTLLSGGRIFANGMLLAAPTVSAFDLDGANGVGAGDLSAWLTDFGSGQPYGRSDYDCSGNIGAGDLSLWLSMFASGTMTASCGTSCP